MSTQVTLLPNRPGTVIQIESCEWTMMRVWPGKWLSSRDGIIWTDEQVIDAVTEWGSLWEDVTEPAPVEFDRVGTKLTPEYEVPRLEHELWESQRYVLYLEAKVRAREAALAAYEAKEVG